MMRTAWLAIAALMLAGAPAAAQQDIAPATGTLLQIEATGSIKAAPDRMTVHAAVVTTAPTAAEALDGNNALAARLIDAVKKSGLRIGGLKTARLSVSPRFAASRRDEDEPTQILGYVASNELDVELAQVAQAGRLVSLLFEAGANMVRGPVFSLADPAPAQRLAERAAIAQARAEAENYAAALGMKVARVVRVFDRNFRDRDDDSIIVSGSSIRATPIEPGELTFEATVHVEFLLAPL